MSLPAAFLTRPIAHRARHGAAGPENSVEAIEAAVSEGWGIEIDLQLSKDGQAMVFHDYDLGRLTGETGPVQQRSSTELGAIRPTGSGHGIPTLHQVLDQIGGRTALLIELKDQHGQMGQTNGALERAAAAALDGYGGPVAVMSFNPEMVAAMAELAPEVPRGLTTSAYSAEDWTLLPATVRERLREIPDYARTGATFISHQRADLTRPRVAELKHQGARILCWTVRSAEEEHEARKVAENITFEGYTPA